MFLVSQDLTDCGDQLKQVENFMRFEQQGRHCPRVRLAGPRSVIEPLRGRQRAYPQR